MSISKIDSERLEYLMRQLRGKINSGHPGNYRRFVLEILDHEQVHHLLTRALYDYAMRMQIAKEMNLAGTH